ncbi:MAG: DUF2846 domain-containing protein [Helicobacteraceae bacterium]|nr:DUF2846 domain-containing protein [Helicobacteraceae bacterium]
MKKSKLVLMVLTLSIVLFSGCSRVPLEPKGVSDEAKSFNLPPEGKSGLYVYRDSFVGQALKKDVWINKKCLGETSSDVFFYETVKGNHEYKLSTESEFSPNVLAIKMKSGKNYFVRQYIKMGLFVGGAGLEEIEESKAKEDIAKLDMAIKGTCSK